MTLPSRSYRSLKGKRDLDSQYMLIVLGHFPDGLKPRKALRHTQVDLGSKEAICILQRPPTRGPQWRQETTKKRFIEELKVQTHAAKATKDSKCTKKHQKALSNPSTSATDFPASSENYEAPTSVTIDKKWTSSGGKLRNTVFIPGPS